MSEGLKPCAAIDHSAFIQILGDVQKERMQHPKRERLVDCDQHDDGRGFDAPDVPFKEWQQIA